MHRLKRCNRRSKNRKSLSSLDAYAVILVGGKGKRLRPLSTDKKPKAFISVTRDRKTMFRRAIDRASKIVPLERIFVVANETHALHIKKDAPDLAGENILLEPVSRNTAPAIALAAHSLYKRFGGCIMVVFPTDQYVIKEAFYMRAVKKGIDFVRNNTGAFVIFGQRPSYPATGFGYIKVSRGSGISKVSRFTEKPEPEIAEKYIENGDYFWNISTFIFGVDTLLRSFKKLAPAIYRGRRGGVNRSAYSRLPDISIDYAIMEKAGNIRCLKGDYGWQDMGSFDSLRKIMKREGRKFVEKDGRITKIL